LPLFGPLFGPPSAAKTLAVSRTVAASTEVRVRIARMSEVSGGI
jgi:hypothetical protein